MVKFIEKSHRYLSDKGELTSVSKFFDQFKPYVNWAEKALKKAKRLTKEGTPTTQKELLDRWANKRDKASSIGTLYHTLRENELLGDKDSQFYGKSCAKKGCTYEGNDKYSIPIHELEDNTVYPELMIYDFEHMICGQSDKVIVVNRTINIWDYKTDKEIKREEYKDKWHPVAQKLLEPLDHLDDCNFNHYAIKMSLYMYMLWKANKGRFRPGDIIIEHVHLERDPDNDGLPVLDSDGKPKVLRVEQIKLPYLKREVMQMLRTRNKN